MTEERGMKGDYISFICALRMFLFLHQTIVNMRDIDSESDTPKHVENGNDQNSQNNDAEDELIHPDFRL